MVADIHQIGKRVPAGDLVHHALPGDMGIWYYGTMATIKRTFTFDEATSIRLDRTAYRLSKPKSEVVREAIRVYSEHIGLLSELERARMLATFDRVVPSIPARPVDDVEAELEQVRQARRGGGRGSEGESI